MITIALIGQKGGTGKTTLARCLAVAFERRAQPAAIIDMDPQASAWRWSRRRAAEYPEVIAIPQPLLEETLEAARESVAYAIIDTPPKNADVAIAAAHVADLIIIPCRAQIDDIETLPATKQLLDVTGSKPAFAVLNAVLPNRSRALEAIATIEGHPSSPLSVCPHTFGQRAAFGDASVLGLTPEEFEPKGKATEETIRVYEYTCHAVDKSALQIVDKTRSQHGTSEHTGRRRPQSRNRVSR